MTEVNPEDWVTGEDVEAGEAKPAPQDWVTGEDVGTGQAAPAPQDWVTGEDEPAVEGES